MPDSNEQSRDPARRGIQIGMGSLLVGLLGIGPGTKAAEATGLHWTAGALIGYWIAVFLFAWIVGFFRERNASNSTGSIGSVLRDPRLWLATLAGAAGGAVIGLWFGPSTGQSALVGAAAIGIMGLAPGFVTGLVVAWIRRRSRLRRAEQAARERFVASLNERSTSDSRHSIDPDHPRVLIIDRSMATPCALDAAVIARLHAAIENRVDFGAAESELRHLGFETCAFRINGETVLERSII
jgi:hypothetical protein